METLVNMLPDSGKKHLNMNKYKEIIKGLSKQKFLHIMALPGIIWMFIFCYIPMAGIIIAFQEYDFLKGVTASPFVGLVQFKELFSDEMFWHAFRNSIGLSLVKIIFSFTTPIIFAILINEVDRGSIRRVVQTISYLPHFISWVVIAGIFKMWLDTMGPINEILMQMHVVDKPVGFLMEPGRFWLLMAVIEVWKETGWWAIIYLAAIVGIPQEIFESATVDGATRLRQIFNIILPSIKNTIIIVFILSMGSLIFGGLSGSNFNQSLLFGNAINYDSSEILDTYVLRMGLKIGRFSFATAAGLIQSLFSLSLFLVTNWMSRSMVKMSLY